MKLVKRLVVTLSSLCILALSINSLHAEKTVGQKVDSTLDSVKDSYDDAKDKASDTYEDAKDQVNKLKDNS